MRSAWSLLPTAFSICFFSLFKPVFTATVGFANSLQVLSKEAELESVLYALCSSFNLFLILLFLIIQFVFMHFLHLETLPSPTQVSSLGQRALSTVNLYQQTATAIMTTSVSLNSLTTLGVKSRNDTPSPHPWHWGSLAILLASWSPDTRHEARDPRLETCVSFLFCQT